MSVVHFLCLIEMFKRKKKIQESTAQLVTLHVMLEIILNRLFVVPHDPYVKISDSFWAPYIELLLLEGTAIQKIQPE